MPNQNHDFKALTPEEAAKENKESICFMCHKKEDREAFIKKIANLQKDVGTRKDKLLKDLEGIKLEMDKLKEANQNVSSLEKEYGTAFTNITIVDSDKSKGIHHPEFTKKLLEDSERRVAELKKKL